MWQKIKNYYHHAQAFLAALFFGFPSQSIKVIGVTGTDGKTTTVHMINQILKDAGYKVSMVSSVGAQIGARTYDTGFHVTTPSAWQIQKYLRRAKDAGHQYFVLETTSHGLDQNRLSFINFEVGVLTNITHDHLDYHKTWQNYALAKAKLFKSVKFSILNLEDPKSLVFVSQIAGGQIITYGLDAKATVSPLNMPLKLKLPGQYNLLNALAAAAAAGAIGVSKSKIVKTIQNFKLPKGRLENVDKDQNFELLIDFAHTPNGLEQVLKTLKSKSQGSRLIAVFGAAGNRDSQKRPAMGKAADKYADIIILTAEDPRGEKVEEINAQIVKGITSKSKDENLFLIEDRKEAIEFAVAEAQENDIVVLLGKGHEKSMCYGKRETPWDEFKTAKNALRRLNVKTSQ